MAELLFETKFHKTLESPKKSLTILSASDNGITFESGSQYDGYSETINIFAEAIHFRNKRTRPNLTVFAATRSTLSANTISTDSTSASVTANGTDGTPNDGATEIGRAATNGSNGREIDCWISQMPSSTQPIRLDAKGGDGATTNSLNIPAGSGGAGGNVRFYGISIWAPVYGALLSFQERFKLPEDWSKEEATKAPMLEVNDDRVLETIGIANLISKLIPNDEPLYPKIWELFEKIVKTRSCSLIALTLTIRRAVRRIDETCAAQTDAQHVLALVSGGRAGPATLVKGERGKNGTTGTAGQASVSISPMLPPVPSFPVVHPFQCQMVLEKARAYFYFGDPGSCLQAEGALRSLVTKLALVFDRPQADSDGVIQKIEECRYALSIDDTLDIRCSLADIYAAAGDLLFQLTCTSVDYYGLRGNWVPRSSVTAFRVETDRAIKRLQSTEEKYLIFLKALREAKVAEENKKDALGQIEATQASISDNIKELRETLKDLKYRIRSNALKESIKSKSREIDYRISQLETSVLTNFSVSPNAIKNALISLAKEPSKETAGKEAAKLVWKGLSTVPNAEGEEVDKTLILDNLETVSGNLTEKFKDFSQEAPVSDDGSVQLDTKNSELLLANRDQIDKMCEDFIKEAFGDKAKKIRDMFREYATLITDRNANIVQYNMVLKNIYDARARSKSVTANDSALQRIKIDKPDTSQLQQVTDLFDDMYHQIRARVMKLISFYRRSIYFSTLVNPNMQDIIGMKNDAALALGHAQLSEMHEKLGAQLFQVREKKGSGAPRFPGNYENDEGKYVELTSLQLEELKINKSLLVNLPAVSLDACAFADFRGCADVRAYRVRFWLDGLAVKSPSTSSDKILVKIGLSHRGDSVFYDTSDQRHEFVHDTIDVSWSYRVPASLGPTTRETVRKKMQVVDSGDVVNYAIGDAEENTAYAAPSPFATWQISLRDLDERLDLKKVTRARFEFCGTSRVFKQ
jgi:hypothetical protein